MPIFKTAKILAIATATKENLFKTSETTLALYLTSSLDDLVLQTSDRRENACTSGSQTAFPVGANELVGSTTLKAC
jgi:hypothetical protein